MPKAESTHTVRNAAKFGSGILVSRLLGLGRDMLLTFVLGGGWAADIFFAAFRIPNFVRRIVYEGALAMAFLPAFNRLKIQHGKAEAYAFGRAAVWQTFAVAALVAMLCIYGSHAVAMLLTPGFAAEPRLTELTGQLIEITVLYLPLVAVSAVIAGMLLSLERYALPSLAAAFLNIAMIGAGVYAVAAGIGGFEAAKIFCYGVVIGGGLQIALQLPPLYRDGFRIFGRAPAHAGITKAFRRNAPQSVAGSASYQFGAVAAMFMASFLGEGSVTALYLAERILELPLALVGVTLGTASIAGFSNLVLCGQKRELGLQMHQVMALGLCLALPAAFGTMALAWPIMGSFFSYGAFEYSSLELTVRALIFYTPLLPAIVISRPMLAALNAGGRASATMAAAAVSLAVLICSAVFLLRVFNLKLEAITISSSLAAWVNTILLGLLLKRCKLCEGPGNGGVFPWKKFSAYFIFSLVMFAGLMLLQAGADHLGLGHIARTALGVPAGIFMYFAMLRLSGSPELKLLLASFARKNDFAAPRGRA